MADYKYEAYDSHGARVQGELEVNSIELAKSQLKSNKLIVTSLKEINKNSDRVALFERQKVSLEELEFITSELAILLQNGVKIDKSLFVLQKSKPQGPVASLLKDLYKAVKRGNTLSDAMADHPKVFDQLYINLVKLGEASGNLSVVFVRLSTELKFRSELKSKIIQSLTYPLVIFTVCILCILFIFNYIVPQMSSLFDGMPELPFYTQVLLNASDWMQNYQLFLFLGMVVIMLSLIAAFRNPVTKRSLDEFLLRVPVIKEALLVVERIRFNSALAMMLEAEISIDKALDLAAGSVKNRFIRQGLNAAKEHIKKGEGLTLSLGKSPLFPDFYLSLLEVGEESGKLSPIFDEIASRSRNEFEARTNKMTSILEPLLILAMGGIVGGVVVTMLLSIVSVNDLGI